MSVATLYNPAGLDKNDLISNFVVRTKVFEVMFEDIMANTMLVPQRPYLIQGQRGMGKTTLLLRLKYEVENTPELSSWLIPIFFNEEMYDLTTLSRLWEKLIQQIDEIWETGGKHYDFTESFIDEPDYEERCFDYLVGILKQKGKKLLLFFDNFGQLFIDNLREKEKDRLKKVILSCPDIRIIGASAIVLGDFQDYAQNFYEHFNVIHLEGLTKEETFGLIARLQENCENKIDLNKSKAKIETLAILTGGVIRTLLMLYQVLLDDQNGTALKDLDIILDRVTPLYKHRIEDLPVQQRRIVDVIAKKWDAVSAKDIADNIREDGKPLATKLVSAQLQQLERNNVIEKKRTGTKNHLYQLKERFFNIWYLMRNGDRRDRVRVVWLTKFLELWYESEDELTFFLHRHLKQLRSGKFHSRSALLIAEALINSDRLHLDKQNLVYNETTAILGDKGEGLLPNPRNRKYSIAVNHFRNRKYDEAIKQLEEIQDRDPEENFLYAWCFVSKNEHSKALQIIEDIAPQTEDEVVTLSILYMVVGNPDKTIALLDENKVDDNGRVLILKADAYAQIGDNDQAEKYFKLAIGNIVDDAPNAYSSYANFLIHQGRIGEVEACLLSGIEKNPTLALYKQLLDFYIFGKDDKVMHYAEASKILQQARKISTTDPDLYFFEGIMHLNSEKVNEVVKKNHGTYFHKARIEYFKKGPEKFDAGYVNITLAVCLIYYKDILLDKKKTTKLVADGRAFDGNFTWDIVQLYLDVWEGRYQGVAQQLLRILTSEDLKHDERARSLCNDLLLLLISRSEFIIVLDVFESHQNLREILKPTFYALMSFLQDKYPNEIIKMGKELQEPLEDILNRIEGMKKDYPLEP